MRNTVCSCMAGRARGNHEQRLHRKLRLRVGRGHKCRLQQPRDTAAASGTQSHLQPVRGQRGESENRRWKRPRKTPCLPPSMARREFSSHILRFACRRCDHVWERLGKAGDPGGQPRGWRRHVNQWVACRLLRLCVIALCKLGALHQKPHSLRFSMNAKGHARCNMQDKGGGMPLHPNGRGT